MRISIAGLLAFVTIGCDSGPGTVGPGTGGTANPIIKRFGSSQSPDGSKLLEVIRKDTDLVDFRVTDSTSGKELAADHIGWSAMRWFLHWETSARLWGYGSDLGYFRVFDFHSDGTVTETNLTEKISIPLPVWKNLPSTLQQRYKAEQAIGGRSAKTGVRTSLMLIQHNQ